MIFPVLELEAILQVDDKTRLDGRKSYTTPDEAAITLIRVEPEAGAGFYDITAAKYLDYQYATDGTKVVTLEITTDSTPVTKTKEIQVLSADDDYLFSGDAELIGHEHNIMEYVPAGRNSYLNVHRTAQDKILDWLDAHRIWDVRGNRLTKEAIVDIEEVNDWSKFLTLQLIFEGLSNSVDDIFAQKSRTYRAMKQASRDRARLRLDRDGDGSVADETPINIQTARLVRR